MKLKKYTEFLNENELEDYKDDLLNNVIDTQPEKEKEQDKPVEDQTYIEVKNNFQVQIEEFEKQKQEIANKIQKTEELLTTGEFSPENKIRLEEEKERLQSEVDKFEEMLLKAQEELKSLEDK